jgi:cytochrome P450
MRAISIAEKPELDLADPALARYPWEVLAGLRRDKPLVAATLGPQTVWLLSRHEDVKSVLDDPGSRMRGEGETCPRALRDGPAARMWRSSLSMMDPPEHTRVRRKLAVAFTHKRAEQLRPLVSGIVDSVVGAIHGRGAIDFARDVALPIPMRVICAVLGVPETDWPMLESWTPDFLRIFQPNAIDSATLQRVDRASGNFIGYFTQLLEERLRDPRDDLVSAFALENDDPVWIDELVAALRGLLTAGFETTASTLSATALCAARDPSLLVLMRSGQTPRRLLAEEMLRWETPVRAHFRVLGEARELHGRDLPAGTTVFLHLGAANRDPAVFTDPESVVPDRVANPHLAFGGGRHFCLGACLARVELDLVLQAMGEFWEELQLAVSDVPRRPNAQFPGITSLPLSPCWRR